MGCDIHMFCEERKTINGETKWVNVDYWKINPYYDKNENNGEREMEVVPLYDGRSYRVFTALCGVRDYHGESPKISEPKGLPVDCCIEINEESERWGSDGHSHSYVTLREVLKFVNDCAPTKCSGYVSPEDAGKLDRLNVKPKMWCQGTSDSTWVHREWEVTGINPLDELLDKMVKRFNKYCNDVSEIEESSLHNFRIVFWFDN